MWNIFDKDGFLFIGKCMLHFQRKFSISRSCAKNCPVTIALCFITNALQTEHSLAPLIRYNDWHWQSSHPLLYISLQLWRKGTLTQNVTYLLLPIACIYCMFLNVPLSMKFYVHTKRILKHNIESYKYQ
jgi:hypothetical protein